MDINHFVKQEMVAIVEGSVFFLGSMLSYKVKSNLNMNSDAIECLCLEISTKKSKNILLF